MSKAKRQVTVTQPSGKAFNERQPPLYKVRNSKIHGKGVFALRTIRKGTRIMEYLGDRITHDEADKRYEDHDPDDNHTFLFIVDKKTVLDAQNYGNDARYVNHSCDGNCDSLIENARVFIEAKRTIKAGDELGYDYEIGRELEDPDNVDVIYACRCGSPKCRGTMLWPPDRAAFEKKEKAKRAKQRAKAKAKKSAAQGQDKAKSKKSKQR